MCGIVGYWCDTEAADEVVARRMASQLRHRGPDDGGVWCDMGVGLALAHRRLSIIDLSQAGQQPMQSPCGRYVLTFNGEIYNHVTLRAELESVGGHFDWRGHSDTETLLACLRHWGCEETLKRLNGMFAFGFWDREARSLLLARDRMGEKPLYYGRNNGVFLFSSQLKGLKVHPRWQGQIDRQALTLYMRYNCVPSPYSIYQGIAKLPPAHYLWVKEGGRQCSEPICYWDLECVVTNRISTSDLDPEQTIDELDLLLRDAVARRMVSDVPLGAFLSGGIDSTTIVALMQAQSSKPVRTFSIGFHDTGFNEAVHAKAVASHLGTEHTELYISSQDAIDFVPKLPEIWDEPFSDSSQIPMALVSRLASKTVTVSLSGDGGDEIFCGYNRYLLGYRVWNQLRRLPFSVRRIIEHGLRASSGNGLENIMALIPKSFRIKNLSDRLLKLADLMPVSTEAGYYKLLVSHWKDPVRLVLQGYEPARSVFGAADGQFGLDMREWMMFIDTATYLPDDILVKVDRATMAFGLEARVPLLDHRVVEFGWQTPMLLKHYQGKGKWILRRLLDRYVPRSLMERPKMGFDVPVANWLHDSLRDWAESLLDEKKLSEQALLDHKVVRGVWSEYLSGKRRCHYQLWDVLMFQAWLERQ